jgi:glucose/arabinose dehydrogenase
MEGGKAMRKLWQILGFSVLVAASVAQTLIDSRLTYDTIISSGLSRPIMMTWLNPANPNDFFVLEKVDDSSSPRVGRVRRVTNGVISEPLLTLEVSSANWEHGLLGIELHPDFEQNGYVYLYYTEPDPNAPTVSLRSRLVRYRFNGTALIEPIDIWTVPIRNDRYHFGGVIRFGPDGKLYIVIGDHRQNTSNTIEVNRNASGVLGAGGIYRLNDDGSIPADNPFASHPDPRIRALYAYGIRNSFGLQFDARTGWLWFTENGPNVYDEINIAFPGMNSGWVKIMGPDARDATYNENGNRAYNASDLVMLPNAYYDDPRFSWYRPIGVAAICFLRSARFDPDLRDQCVIGESVNSRLYLFQMNAQRDGFIFTDSRLQDLVADDSDERNLNAWGTNWGVVSDLKIGPDGYLYVISHLANRIYRIRPVNSPEIINGQVILTDYQGQRLGVPLTLTLRQGGESHTISTTLDAFGRFSERVPGSGTYTVIAKAGSYLSVKREAVQIDPQGFAYLKLVFNRAGDLNNDNLIDDADLLQVLFEFGSSSRTADVNGDGIVDDADLLIVLFNFGESGDE